MPSHAAHLLFALQSARLPVSPEYPLLAAVNHGAQWPDQFYHNQRSQPSALYLGVALHKRGMASLAAAALARAGSDAAVESAWALLSHAVLDRWLHPWINCRAGWFDPAAADSWRFRHQHPLLERLIDVWLCRRYDAPWLLGPDFARAWGPPPRRGETPPPAPGADWLPAVKGLYPRAAADAELAARLDNAWRDSRGYYHWSCALADAEYAAMEAEARACHAALAARGGSPGEDAPLRYAAIVHPRLPRERADELDAIFCDNAEWLDPCAAGGPQSASLAELWEGALGEMRGLRGAMAEMPAGRGEADIAAALAAAGIHDGDLRSRAAERPGLDLQRCRPRDWFGFWFGPAADAEL